MGVRPYADALTHGERLLLLRRCVENIGETGRHKEEEIEALVRLKYEHVLSCQMYGVKGWESKDKQIVEMCKAHPHTVLTHYEQPDLAAKSMQDAGSYYYLCRSRIDYEEDPAGIMKLTHRIRLPGNPIVGEGKPENQNLGIVYAKGITCKQSI